MLLTSTNFSQTPLKHIRKELIILKKSNSERTPPVVKAPRPLITMGDVWNIVFAIGALLLQKASGALLAIVKAPYNLVNNSIKTISKIPLAGKAAALPLKPIRALFGGIVAIVGKFAIVFKVIFIALLIILAIKIFLKLVSRIAYMRNKKKYKEYHKDLEERLERAESSAEESSTGMRAMNYY